MGCHPTKRLIIACDGTWMSSDTTSQTPSNITRLTRCLLPRCRSSGTLQIILYQSGVGTGSTVVDSVVGGAFGTGITERIREAYAFLCANYDDGDEIVLLGFSRGAFTARSVAGMIGELGLLTSRGMEEFSIIFEDMRNWGRVGHVDKFPDRPFSNKPTSALFATEEDPNPSPDKDPGLALKIAAAYRARLEEEGLTRVHYTFPTGPDAGTQKLITVKAIGVFDTVGSLGIPQVGWMHKLGFQPSHKAYQFWDTTLSDRIEHAFHALALDETRPPFSPAVWERREEDELKCDLRQVWFPGSHANVGGGWPDQEIANISMAWMMDQLASIGVEFDFDHIQRMFDNTKKYFQNLPASERPELPITRRTFYENSAGNHPSAPFLRPWACGKISKANSVLYSLAGTITRTPGMYHRVNLTDGTWNLKYLERTNERIHSSVRVRLQCRGLGLNDAGYWDCPALAGWKLVKKTGDAAKVKDPVPAYPDWLPEPWLQEDVSRGHISETSDTTGRWMWEYQGNHDIWAKTLHEEPIGPIERHLLYCFGGSPRNTFEFAEDMRVENLVQPPKRRVSSYRELWERAEGGLRMRVREKLASMMWDKEKGRAKKDRKMTNIREDEGQEDSIINCQEDSLIQSQDDNLIKL